MHTKSSLAASVGVHHVRRLVTPKHRIQAGDILIEPYGTRGTVSQCFILHLVGGEIAVKKWDERIKRIREGKKNRNYIPPHVLATMSTEGGNDMAHLLGFELRVQDLNDHKDAMSILNVLFREYHMNTVVAESLGAVVVL